MNFVISYVAQENGMFSTKSGGKGGLSNGKGTFHLMNDLIFSFLFPFFALVMILLIPNMFFLLWNTLLFEMTLKCDYPCLFSVLNYISTHKINMKYELKLFFQVIKLKVGLKKLW